MVVTHGSWCEVLLDMLHYAPPIGWGIMHSWPLSVRLSVCPVPQPKSRIEGLGKLKIGRKKAHDKWSVTPFRDRNVVGQGNQANKRRYRKSAISSEREGLRTSNFVHGWSTMTRITDMRGDLQTESSGWLFKSPLAEGTCTCGGRTTYRPHSVYLSPS